MGERENVRRERVLADSADGSRGSGEQLAQCTQNNGEPTTMANIVGVYFHHTRLVGLPLLLDHFRIKAIMEGRKKAHVEKETSRGSQGRYPYGDGE